MSADPAAAVHRAVVLPVSREEAWKAVTEPEQLACWLADEVELDAREGGVARFAWEDGTTRVGVVDELAEERRIAFRWSAAEPGDGEDALVPADAGAGARGPHEESLVELTLDDVEGGTRVSVVEVRTSVLATGDVPLAPAGTPSAWTPRMAALAACCVATWA